MQRDVNRLKSREFDVLVIGAGSHGACAARDAALRGLNVALIDKGDICGATSHNSLKTIHGGIRYLQHLNFKRTLESIKEQKVWLRTAPHLVKPLPFLMPTYGHGLRGPLAMLAGITLYQMLGIGRNKYLRDDRKIPAGRIMSKAECSKLAPNISTEKLSGGALWYDAQIEHSDRAVMQVAEHANQLGAVVANYVKASQLHISDGVVKGVMAMDELTAQTFAIRAKTVINAAGPWASEVLAATPQVETNFALTKSMNLVTNLPAPDVAIAVQSSSPSDSMLGDTNRLYFIVPWLGRMVIGTTQSSFTGKADQLSIENDEIVAFVEDINRAYPSLKLKPESILYCYQGLLPAGKELSNSQHQSDGNNAMQLHESKVIDHATTHNVGGLVSILSVKWTTARLVAKQAVDVAASKLGNTTQSKTEHEPLVDHLKLEHEISSLDDAQLTDFCHSHMQNSMVVTLADLLLHRSNDLVLGKLTLHHIRVIARAMQHHFNWTAQQQQQQLDALLANWLPNDLKKQIRTHSIWAS